MFIRLFRAKKTKHKHVKRLFTKPEIKLHYLYANSKNPIIFGTCPSNDTCNCTEASGGGCSQCNSCQICSSG